MQPPVFYSPPENIADGQVRLPAAEARHAISVMRLKPAAIIFIANGLGTGYRAEIIRARGDVVIARLHAEIRNMGEPNVRLTLAAGLSAGHKFDTTVEKGTELGVKRFVPILSEKSKVKMEDSRRAAARLKRLERVALAAMKQCRRAYRPDIATPTTFRAYLEEQNEEDLRLIFHSSSRSLPLDQIEFDSDSRRISLLVGPEPGFSDDEFESACEAGFIPTSLGSRVLRSETAGPAAAATLMYRLGEFR